MLNARTILAAACVAAAISTRTQAQPALSSGHVDIGLAYADGAWDLHIHDETTNIEYAPNEARLQLKASAATTAPADPRFSFLGTPGSPLWLLPQLENPDLLFLGLAAEEIGSGAFTGDQMRMTLKAATGPGNFFLYSTSGVTGVPDVRMNTSDGIADASDFATVLAGGHTDYNWAFTAPGNYTLTFEASGNLVAGNLFTASGPVDYSFEVVPEPGTVALISIGGSAILLHLCRRGKHNRS
jgi:surface-anchored protein